MNTDVDIEALKNASNNHPEVWAILNQLASNRHAYSESNISIFRGALDPKDRPISLFQTQRAFKVLASAGAGSFRKDSDTIQWHVNSIGLAKTVLSMPGGFIRPSNKVIRAKAKKRAPKVVAVKQLAFPQIDTSGMRPLDRLELVVERLEDLANRLQQVLGPISSTPV